MNASSKRRQFRKVLVASLASAGFAIAALISTPVVSYAAPTGPCDIYASGGTPCVAAHSTTRALYASYTGSLYAIRRASDGASTDVGVASDGYSNTGTQTSFCTNTTCVVTVVYDQSPGHNNLTVEGPGGAGGQDNPVPADALPITVGGHTHFGLSFSGVMGYRNNNTSGVATGSQPEGEYMVTSGTHYNNRCCFDYGNTETTNYDTGNGHMDAINFGNECWFSPCYGSGPWVEADLENGLFQSAAGGSSSSSNLGNANPYVTAMVKNNGTNFFAIKDGNAQAGGLYTDYSGALPTSPSGYSPMHKEGGIVLGTGGDNSNGSIGSFFEGAMTAGMPSDTTDNNVQANIAAVQYGAPSPVAGGTLNAGSTISLRATTAGYTDHYIRHQNNNVTSSVISSSSSTLDKNDASWIVRPGLVDGSCISFESRDYPGDFLRHFNFQLYRQPMDGSAIFRADATFCPKAGNGGTGTSFASYNFPTKFIRHYNNTLYIASNGGSNAWDATASWAAETTWAVTAPWAP